MIATAAFVPGSAGAQPYLSGARLLYIGRRLGADNASNVASPLGYAGFELDKSNVEIAR